VITLIAVFGLYCCRRRRKKKEAKLPDDAPVDGYMQPQSYSPQISQISETLFVPTEEMEGEDHPPSREQFPSLLSVLTPWKNGETREAGDYHDYFNPMNKRLPNIDQSLVREPLTSNHPTAPPPQTFKQNRTSVQFPDDILGRSLHCQT
jgi:hypothetical protein